MIMQLQKWETNRVVTRKMRGERSRGIIRNCKIEQFQDVT